MKATKSSHKVVAWKSSSQLNPYCLVFLVFLPTKQSLEKVLVSLRLLPALYPARIRATRMHSNLDLHTFWLLTLDLVRRQRYQYLSLAISFSLSSRFFVRVVVSR